MEEGRRMFQIFAARMFEQRVLQAYREKVAAERQQKLLEELAEEDVRKDAKEAKKAKEAQKRKEKKDKQRQNGGGPSLFDGDVEVEGDASADEKEDDDDDELIDEDTLLTEEDLKRPANIRKL